MELLILRLKHERSIRNILQFILLLAIFFLLSIKTAYTQVTIGSNIPPDNSALLDLKEENSGTSTKGLLLPRVPLQRLDLPNPLLEHKKGMFIYNLTVDSTNSLTEGIYYNDGYKWNNVSPINKEENGYTLTSAVALSNYKSIEISHNITDDNSIYTKDMPISNLWHPIFETNINVSSGLNKLLVEAQLPVQISQVADITQTLSYAVGLFINNKLAAVRLDINSMSNKHPFFQKQILLLATNLPIGKNTLKLCFIKRKLNSDNIYVGSSFPAATNTNDFMLRPTMSYSLFESESTF